MSTLLERHEPTFAGKLPETMSTTIYHRLLC